MVEAKQRTLLMVEAKHRTLLMVEAKQRTLLMVEAKQRTLLMVEAKQRTLLMVEAKQRIQCVLMVDVQVAMALDIFTCIYIYERYSAPQCTTISSYIYCCLLYWLRLKHCFEACLNF